MITLDEFVKKYNGKFLDWDNSYGNQCVDLFRFYLYEVLDVPQSRPVAGAADIWDAVDGTYFEKIPNTPEGVPEKGDIVIWNKNVGGGYGHVAIFLRGDVNTFTSLDQNWPTDSAIHEQAHNYQNVIGWLRLKKDDPSCQAALDECRDARDSHWNDLVEIKRALGLDDNASLDTTLKSISGMKGRNTELTKKVAELESEVKNREEQVKRLEGDIANLEKELAEARSTVVLLHNQVDELSKTIGTLNNELAKCQAGQPNTLKWWQCLLLSLKR